MNRPIHFEILGNDPAALADFYERVFDWKISRWEGPQAYYLCSTGEQGLPGIDGAIMARHFEQSVINTIEVGSLDDALRAIEAAGGRKVMGPNQIPGVGMHAYCVDPEENLFGILEPEPRTDG